jgi:hypothetical protein
MSQEHAGLHDGEHPLPHRLKAFNSTQLGLHIDITAVVSLVGLWLMRSVAAWFAKKGPRESAPMEHRGTGRRSPAYSSCL